ncbi:dTDP-4-dehydrorhamnose 3,5-epimerase [Massilia sp. Dwa41.01b]|uniref:dTDP-4-dehydrorhamnose 3,5-epimerase n=1 Tax=unclassified Massilia TaxID=2609279 RepID=UPI0015FFBD7B|nr:MULTISPECIES: dTDP-4-dehydrorhamnose 3,5-epimerase [unclassified Massilia]QNA90110.1 dTDP-4-dehydrorhamnose 3,5-epimerase [Massilia sp. Dwa41.01b]QNB00999.1 dTDP-4-dehydrorhamnose 3,5-epimerase [Massilia sp. Se16.2.3]
MSTVAPLAIPEVLLLTPQIHGDARGFLYESFHQARFEAALGRSVTFVQENHSKSGAGVLRGLHYQLHRPQGKLIRVVAGSVYDVAVDLRRGSPTCGQWVAEVLSADNARQMWIPEGFAHGFLVLSESAELLYKTTDYWSPADERCIAWDDPQLAVAWPLAGTPLLSEKDRQGRSFADAELAD